MKRPSISSILSNPNRPSHQPIYHQDLNQSNISVDSNQSNPSNQINNPHQHHRSSQSYSSCSYSYSSNQDQLRFNSNQLADLALSSISQPEPFSHNNPLQSISSPRSISSSDASSTSDFSTSHQSTSLLRTPSSPQQPKSFQDQHHQLTPLISRPFRIINNSISTNHDNLNANYGSIPTTHQNDTTPTKNKPSKSNHLIKNASNQIPIILGYIPAVILGLMMNILDGVSYGLIIFPNQSHQAFDGLGSIGISMFFLSCIISQLVYSLGASAFKGGNGSMMIESIPFMHVIANKIADQIGDSNPDAILATTLMAFAFSTFLTGLAFFSLGALKLGNLMGFFPRHILVGCIGSVGVFLFLTGVQVTAQFPDAIGLNFDTFAHLSKPEIIPLWIVPLSLAMILRVLSAIITHPFFVPTYFIIIPIGFYIITSLILKVPIENLRSSGWIFNLPAPNNSTAPTGPLSFYSYFKFREINWSVFQQTLTSQLAMVIFGLLHVPLNVPALSISLGMDDIDIDRELIAHGISNTVASLFGTVSNYLCYVNSVLFVKVGGDSRVAGLMLSIGMIGIFAIGPQPIAFLPVCVVGALIFLLGFDLLKEAVWDTWWKVSWAEYGTIWAIIIAATWHDFVVGLVVGIILACISFVVTVSQHRAIRSVMDGRLARSTVRRHPTQHEFLKRIGSQIRVIKLQGHLFFGTISECEKTMKGFFESGREIQHLVLDLTSVDSIDFSAIEGLLRIERLLKLRGIIFVIGGASDKIGKALRSVGLWNGFRDQIEVFETLNQALEFCENVHLRSLYPTELILSPGFQQQSNQNKPKQALLRSSFSGEHNEEQGSPRNTFRLLAAKDLMSSAGMITPQQHHSSLQPTQLLFQTFRPFLPELNQDFWKIIAPYFKRIEMRKGEVLWEIGSNPDCFYLIETGILRATYGQWPTLKTEIEESMLPGTIAGDHTFLSILPRNTKVMVESEVIVLWEMRKSNWDLDVIGSERRELISRGMLRMAAVEEEVLIGHLLTRF
ncbi:uncharacterized protein MELLADRAFT_117613 [Melampsora larici-populina 98AG31]|uniref:Sulfate transporter family-domain-containing protein n=1 Tax=Melampsora larici-populina (strain 98AG31 / pathotype 3-4-7) TaxID=747676 RepID=F4RZE2_MELLP|nr:uncharacterized protein MELLADRAFT_117613 [Melampsora larici-populina 98AG31]EGG02270.1 hypothetical protein MELLADRAFT_117613 [Melampsora larici-populina 98AG31]